MIFLKNPVGMSDAKFKISAKPSGFMVEGIDSGFKFEFVTAAVTDRPDIMFLYRDAWGQPAFTWFSEIASNRDGYISSRLRKRSFDPLAPTIAAIGVDESGAAFIYSSELVFTSDAFQSVPDELVNGNSMSDVLGEMTPSLSKFAKHCRLKQIALGKISPTDSLAALEAQVDLLTRALTEVIAGMPAESRPGWWPGVELAFGPLTSVDSVEKAISDAVEQKAKVRQVQKDYFAAVKAVYED